MLVIGGDDEVGFGGKEMVETALVDLGALANVIHADGTVAVVPHQVESDLEEAFLRLAGLFHRQNNVNSLNTRTRFHSFTDQSTE